MVINLGEKVFGSKVLNTSTILVFQTPGGLADDKKIIVSDLRHHLPAEKVNIIKQIEKTNKKDWIQTVFNDANYTYFAINLKAVNLFQKLSQAYTKFKDIIDGEIQRGISPDYAPAFIIDNNLAKKNQIEKNVIRPVVLGKHISRYSEINSSCSIIYLTRKDDINNYPYAKAHLNRYRDKITCREVKEGKHPWYSLHRPRKPSIFKPPKFIGLTTTKKICIALDKFGYYASDALYLFKIKKLNSIQEYFFLGILHSKLFQFLYQLSTQGEQRVIPQIKAVKLYDLPLPVPNLSEKKGETQHNQVVKLVTRMLDLNKQLAKAKTPQTRTVIQRQIETTDQQIDELVYELYGLTKEEIKIVEKSLE